MEKGEEKGEGDFRRKGYALRRSIMDYGMGVIIISIGIIVLLSPKLKLNLAIDDLYRYMFFGLCMLYGGFRIYRGVQKNYFND